LSNLYCADFNCCSYEFEREGDGFGLTLFEDDILRRSEDVSTVRHVNGEHLSEPATSPIALNTSVDLFSESSFLQHSPPDERFPFIYISYIVQHIINTCIFNVNIFIKFFEMFLICLLNVEPPDEEAIKECFSKLNAIQNSFKDSLIFEYRYLPSNDSSCQSLQELKCIVIERGIDDGSLVEHIRNNLMKLGGSLGNVPQKMKNLL
jgi:hypothetical protein